ncbi:hypothetical protein [Bosea sp. (in: a-proteobacteria)]|uniref:hypothetical protein n=1 Tax=Bosea sp. (in: a-proteobacteria) TaxID=1871050 RepID=UPI002734F62A|nr:hypothetical protein [Bosea sp. (in: a-proteobacteria)]MDP3408088.1 hypothetical protein [Bosea sp. (in: a-proteobacteria)]
MSERKQSDADETFARLMRNLERSGDRMAKRLSAFQAGPLGDRQGKPDGDRMVRKPDRRSGS